MISFRANLRLSTGGAAPAAQSAAASAAQAADGYSGESMPEQLDEFGRDVNVEKRREAFERCGCDTAWP